MRRAALMLCGLLAAGSGVRGDLEHADPVEHTTISLKPLARAARVVVAVAYSPAKRITVLPAGVAERFAAVEIAAPIAVESRVPAQDRMRTANTGIESAVAFQLVALDLLAARFPAKVDFGFADLNLVASLHDAVAGVQSLAEVEERLALLPDVASFVRFTRRQTELEAQTTAFAEVSTTASTLPMTVPAFGLVSGVDGLDIDGLMLPCRVWRGSPVGELREAIRRATARGDVEMERQLTADYWRMVNQVLARRRLFRHRENARSKKTLVE